MYTKKKLIEKALREGGIIRQVAKDGSCILFEKTKGPSGAEYLVAGGQIRKDTTRRIEWKNLQVTAQTVQTTYFTDYELKDTAAEIWITCADCPYKAKIRDVNRFYCSHPGYMQSLDYTLRVPKWCPKRR